jgi:hypothetical protein
MDRCAFEEMKMAQVTAILDDEQDLLRFAPGGCSADPNTATVREGFVIAPCHAVALWDNGEVSLFTRPGPHAQEAGAVLCAIIGMATSVLGLTLNQVTDEITGVRERMLSVHFGSRRDERAFMAQLDKAVAKAEALEAAAAAGDEA